MTGIVLFFKMWNGVYMHYSAKQKKDFDSWNVKKKHLHRQEFSKNFFYHEREVWWCSLGINIGVESNGKNEQFERPILVVKKFNKDMFWGIPLTSKPKTGEFFYKIQHPGGTSWAMLSQLKTLSSKRLLRKIGMIPINDFLGTLRKLQILITIEPPPKGKRFSEAEATNT